MEDAAIREGFEKLKPGSEYDALYEAALCLERADWIVGMNATRLFSCLYGQTLAVGRVMTPTLAMVVMRDAQITAFKPEPFWTVQLTASGVTAASRRFKDQTEAEKLLAACKAEGKVTVEASKGSILEVESAELKEGKTSPRSISRKTLFSHQWRLPERMRSRKRRSGGALERRPPGLPPSKSWMPW